MSLFECEVVTVAVSVIGFLAVGFMLSDVGPPENKHPRWVQVTTFILFLGPLWLISLGLVDRVEPLWAEWALVVGAASAGFTAGRLVLRVSARLGDDEG